MNAISVSNSSEKAQVT